MTVKQLSVFIENKSGSLRQVLQTLKNAHIQLIATTLADTTDFGIYRIICSEPTRAYNVLKSAGIAVTYTDVFAIQLDNTPGMAADAIAVFADQNIDIAYLYSFLLGGKGILIFRTNHPEHAREIIILEHLTFITEEGLLNLANT